MGKVDGWYCAHCQRGVPSFEVTYEETHTVCGRCITDDEAPPPADRIASLTEAVRVLTEALEALQRQALQSELNSPSHEWGWEALQMTRAALTTAKELTK